MKARAAFQANGLLDDRQVFARGRFQGMHLREVSSNYLQQLIDTNQDTIDVLQDELARREAIDEANQSTIEKVITAGYREMAKRLHPDAGGDADQMRELNAAVAKLRDLAAGVNG
jgi:hypothetical protein